MFHPVERVKRAFGGKFDAVATSLARDKEGAMHDGEGVVAQPLFSGKFSGCPWGDVRRAVYGVSEGGRGGGRVLALGGISSRTHVLAPEQRQVLGVSRKKYMYSLLRRTKPLSKSTRKFPQRLHQQPNQMRSLHPCAVRWALVFSVFFFAFPLRPYFRGDGGLGDRSGLGRLAARPLTHGRARSPRPTCRNLGGCRKWGVA